MVVISIKNADGDGFLFETTTDALSDDVVSSLVNIHNLRLQARVVADAAKGLAKYGPMKNKDECNTENSAALAKGSQQERSDSEHMPDPTGVRTGYGPEPQLAMTIQQVATELEECVDKFQVQRKVALTEDVIKDKIANVRGAIIMAYPMGLPEWEIVKMALDSIDYLQQTSIAKQVLFSDQTSLWYAGKPFPNAQPISTRLGKNEKTKIIAKLVKNSDGPPSREPLVSEEERKAMMAHYFKRQQELKSLAEAEDDDEYLNSGWADPKEMKRQLQGLSGIRAPGVRF